MTATTRHVKYSWKIELAKLIEANKTKHASRDKTVGTRTKDYRYEVLFQAFKTLRHELGCKIENPRNFKEFHFQRLLDHWIATELAPATIQSRASVIRVFCTWINKPNMIRNLEEYVTDPTKVRRSQIAKVDKSWSTNGVSYEDKLKEIEEYDLRAGAQLRMIKAFGLRRKEAVCFRPIVAMRLGEASTSITVEFGTKGGRPRSVPIDSDEKREALANACKVSKLTNGHIGWEELSLEQAVKRFANIMQKFGITKKDSGVTAHGLRHEYLNDKYEDITGVPSPVRGGLKADVDPELDLVARTLISLDAGHVRTGITNAYAGSHNTKKATEPNISK